MIPYVVIGITALVGLFGWGLTGLIIGGVAGFVFNLLFGSLLTLFSGGLLPRKVRQQTASSFIILHPDLVRSVFPKTSHGALQKEVQNCIENIFKRAVTDNKSIHLDAAMNRTAIQAAAAALIAEEHRPEMKTLLASLEQHIEGAMYP